MDGQIRSEQTSSPLISWWAHEGTSWERLIEPHPDVEDAAARRRARLLAAVMLPLVPTLAVLLTGLSLFALPIDASAVVALRAVGFALLLVYSLAYVLSRTRYHELGAYSAVTATELGAWLMIALASGSGSIGLMAAFLVVGVLLAAVFLNVEAVTAVATLNGMGTMLLPILAGVGPSDLFLLFALQAVAYPFLIASAWVRRHDLATIETQAIEIETVLDSIPDTVLSVDPKLRLKGANLGARSQMSHWFGTNADRGIPLQSALPTDVVQSLEHALRRSDVEGRVGFDIKEVPTEAGPRDLEFIVNPLRNHQGVSDGYVVLASDATDRNAALDLERRAYEQSAQISKLEEVNQFKTQLLNTASHELRTPLTPIRLQLSVLRNDRKMPLAEHQVHAIDVVERNTLRLERLVSDILDVARIESDQLKLNLQPVDLFTLVRDEVESFQPVAEAAGIGLSLHLPDNEESFIAGDSVRLGQVMGNLLSNALKFAEGGNVEVSCSADSDRFHVVVVDDGIGMNPEAVGQLFRPFSQIHDENHLARGGSGLGLYICKGIIEGHGGHIEAQSDGLGKGARMRFDIPRAAPETVAA